MSSSDARRSSSPLSSPTSSRVKRMREEGEGRRARQEREGAEAQAQAREGEPTVEHGCTSEPQSWVHRDQQPEHDDQQPHHDQQHHQPHDNLQHKAPPASSLTAGAPSADNITTALLHTAPSQHSRELRLDSEPAHRPPNLQIVDSLLSIQESVFEYFIVAMSFLSEELPALMYQRIRMHGVAIPNLSELTKRLELIRKFKDKVKYLDEFDQVAKIFQTIFSFVEDDLHDMLACVIDLKDKYPVDDDEVISREVPVGDDTKLMSHFIHSLFQGTQFLQTLEFTLGSSSWIHRCEDDAQFTEDKLTQEVYEMHDDASAEASISLCKINISSYGQLYRQWAQDATQYMLFRTSLMKELSFNPALNYNFDLDYDNSILRQIVNNELNNSPNSYNEEECKVLDVMEILTFHVDSCEVICTLICQLDEIISKKKKRRILPRGDEQQQPSQAFRILRSGSRSTSTPVRFIPIRDDPLDTREHAHARRHNTPSDHGELSHALTRFVEATLNPSIRSLVDGGTVGLSKSANLSKVVDLLAEFKSLLDRFRRIDFDIEKAQFFYKEEFHFIDVVDKYHDSLELLLNLVINDSSRVSRGIIEMNKDEFEELDMTVKDCFFDLTYFTQRFKYELAIAEMIYDSPRSS